MKKHLRFILMAIVAMIVPLIVHAQEDVTATYLQNPSFEEGDVFFHDSTKVVVGWDVSKQNLLLAYHNDDADATKDGTFIMGIWDPSNIGDFQISQTVKNLPAGTYVISCLMTVPENDNTTQRLFLSTPSVGTKSLVFASSTRNNVVIPGEDVSFAGLVVDGNGRGPLKEMSLRIKVAQGDSIVFGIRTNGVKSTIFSFADVGGAGWFKVDKFQMAFLSDEEDFNKKEILKKLTIIKAVPTDSIPGGYANIIQALSTEAEGKVASESNLDSLEAFNVKMDNFIATLKSARGSFNKLRELMMKVESTMETTALSGEELLQAAFDSAFEVYFSFESLIADFEAAYTSLNTVYLAHIDGRVEENLALIASVSTSFVSSWEKLSAINDGFEPTNSVDRPHPVYGNWEGDAGYGKTNWVQYEWPYYHNVKEISVYWFHDFGGLSQPNATNVEYWENSAWKTISPIDTLLNQWNTLKVDIKTNKVRLSFSSPTSTGIVEFKVMGFEKKTYDVEDFKTMIRGEIAAVSAINQDSIPKGYSPLTTTIKQQGETLLAGNESLETLTAFHSQISVFHALLDSSAVVYKNVTSYMVGVKAALDTTAFDGKDKLQLAYDNTLAVVTSPTSLIANFYESLAKLKEAKNAYINGKVLVNLALTATASTSYCSSWEKLAKINDGFEPTSSTDNSHGKYGNWNGSGDFGKTNWVQYDWAVPQTVKNLSVYWFTDNGGLMIPTQAIAEYWNGTEWKTAGDIGLNADQYNSLDVNLTTTKIRVSMSSTTSTSIVEFKVTGYEAVITNLALIATSSTSYCSSWEKLIKINDGFDPASSTDNSHGKYGNWNGSGDFGKTNWVQYDWSVAHMITSVSAYWFTDNGGLLLPSKASLEYWDGAEWKAAGAVDTLADQYNTLNVNFTTSKVRLSMNSTTSTGIIEFKVNGIETTAVGIAPVKQINDVNVYPTSIKRGSALNIAFSKDLAKPVSVEMFMINGKKVYQTSVSEKYSTVNVPNTLSSGIYLMVLDALEGRITKKLVVE